MSRRKAGAPPAKGRAAEPTAGAPVPSGGARDSMSGSAARGHRRRAWIAGAVAAVLVAAAGIFFWGAARTVSRGRLAGAGRRSWPRRSTSAPRNAPPATPRSRRRGTAPTTISRCRSPTSKSVLGDFANAKFTYAGTTSTFSRRDGKFFVNTDGPDGKLADYEIKYTFGVHPLQQYLIELPGGRMQALGIAWDSRPKAQGGQRWFHLYPGPEHQGRRPAALDRRAAELELPVRRVPLDQPAQELRRARPARSRRRGRRSTCRARRATARARTTSRGRRSRATGRRSPRPRASRSRSTSARA